MTVARYWFEEYSDDELYARLTQRGVSAESARLWIDNRDADDSYVDEIAYVLEAT